MKRSTRDRILAMVLALMAGACASTPEGPPVDAKPPTYAERVEKRIVGAAEREVHELRYNPGLCGCPPFELELEGRWHRVTFDVADDSHPVLVELREAVERDEASGDLGRYVIQGRLEDRVGTCGQGALFLTLDPTAYGAPESEPSEGESSEEPSEESPDEPSEEETPPAS